jgi:alpha-glucoside transport system permease protein
MEFEDISPKLTMLLYGLIAFVVVVGGLLLLLDTVPAFFGRRRERRLVAVAAGDMPASAVKPRKPREYGYALFFLFPVLVLLAIGLVVPAIRTTVLSFMNGDSSEVVGFANYSWMFTNDDAVKVLLNSLLWVVLVPTVATSVGLLYAVLVDKARLEAVAKSLVFLPMAISFVGASIIWKFVYAYRSEEQDQIGLLNQIVVWFGGTPKQWLLDSPLNTLLLIVVMVWIQAGFAMVILSAAIKGIPVDIVEAARLDGVNAWQMFWRVTLPSIRSAVIVVFVTITIAVLKVFDIVRTMTGGQFDTSVVANELYAQAFRAGQAGRGSALTVFLFVLVLPIVFYQVRQLRRNAETR